jgi:type II secretion system protein I
LLEVVISIAILAMSVALLSQVIQFATDNAINAKEELQASLICESKLAEFALSTTPLQSTSWLTVTDQPYATQQWYYRVDALKTNLPDMFSVTVYVGTEAAAQNLERPKASLTRWYVDPMLNMDVPADQSATATAGTTSSTGGSAAGGVQ